MNEIKYYGQKGNLSRNDKCPCGNGKKVKNCHKEFLDIRHYVTQKDININTALAAHNRAADLKTQGYHRLSRQEFLDKLESKEKENTKPNEA